jgi:peptidoglycan biosynthesis protein MviN/MurJ (putative lipid II flippase)
MASSSLWAAVSQVAALGVQGVAALLILLLFGKGTDTDAVFAAYGIYGVIVLMCQTLRLTVVARLLEGPSPWAAFDRYLGAGLSLVAIAIVIQLLFGAVIARLLTADLGQHAEDLTRSTLSILCIAVVGQLVAAMGAAALAVRDEFRLPGLIYVAGGLTTIAVLLALQGPLDIKAAPIGVAAGSALSGCLMLGRLWQYGYRPSVVAVLAGGRRLRTAAMLLVGAVGPLLGQLNFVISLAFAAHLGAGTVTLYAGSFFAGAAVVAVTGSAASLVLAAPIAQTWDGNASSLLAPLTAIMRAGLIVIGPAVAVVALVGDDFVAVALGSSFTGADAHRMVIAFVALSGFFVGMLALPLPLLAAFALSRYGAVARIAVVGTVVHAVASAIAQSLGSMVWLSVAASLSALTTSGLLLWFIHRSQVLAAWRIVAGETVLTALAVGCAFALPAAVAYGLGGGWWDLAAAVSGAAAFAVVLRSAMPEHAAVAARMLGPVLSAALPRRSA